MIAFNTILPVAIAGFARISRSIEPVPVAVVRTRELIKFSTPASEVEMKPLVGMDGGPITVNGLSHNTFHVYIQSRSVKHVYKGTDRELSHSGTNGFVSRTLASS